MIMCALPLTTRRDTSTPVSRTASISFSEVTGVDDHPVRDHRRDVRVQDAGRDQLQLEQPALGDHGVAGVVAALVPNDEVHPVGEVVDGLALALIPPLGPEHDGGRHEAVSVPRAFGAPDERDVASAETDLLGRLDLDDLAVLHDDDHRAEGDVGEQLVDVQQQRRCSRARPANRITSRGDRGRAGQRVRRDRAPRAAGDLARSSAVIPCRSSSLGRDGVPVEIGTSSTSSGSAPCTSRRNAFGLRRSSVTVSPSLAPSSSSCGTWATRV